MQFFYNYNNDHRIEPYLQTQQQQDLAVIEPSWSYDGVTRTDQFARELNLWARLNQRRRLLFLDSKEAPNPDHLCWFGRVLARLDPRLQVTYCSGYSTNSVNHQRIRSTLDYYGLASVAHINIDYWLLEWHLLARSIAVDLADQPKTHNFLMFLGTVNDRRAHRLILLSHVVSRAISCTWSCLSDRSAVIGGAQGIMGNRSTPMDFGQVVQSLDHINFPRALSARTDSEQHQYSQLDNQLFRSTRVSIIAETSFFRLAPVDLRPRDSWNFHLDYIFLTEKTYRSILGCHPLILLARPGSLAHLRSLGFRTFDSFWSEDYDLIQDDWARLGAITALIESIDQWSACQWADFDRAVQPTVQHNLAQLRRLQDRVFHQSDTWVCPSGH